MAGRDEATPVQIKLRMKEPLRAMLEESARERGISMNAELVRRLERSFERRDRVINGTAIGAELYRS
jgi:Arc-like DNA binding domain